MGAYVFKIFKPKVENVDQSKAAKDEHVLPCAKAFEHRTVHECSTKGTIESKLPSEQIVQCRNVEELQENLRDRILSLEHEFIKFLKPSDVIFDIQGLDDSLLEKILETEKNSREEAVKVLLTNIVEEADLVSKFVFALESKGYRRFIDPINGTYPEKGVMFCQDYIGFIMNYLKGELIDVLQTETLCRYMYAKGCLEQSDMEHIEAVCSTRGRTAACKELFLAVRRRKANWALLMVEAIKSTQEYVKVKMDPSSTQEDLKRTGVHVCFQEDDYGRTFENEDDLSMDMFNSDVELNLSLNSFDSDVDDVSEDEERTGVRIKEHGEDNSLYGEDDFDILFIRSRGGNFKYDEKNTSKRFSNKTHA